MSSHGQLEKRKEPGTCNGITKGLPSLLLGAMFMHASISHNNLRIVCDSVNDLGRDLEELGQRFGPVEQTTANALRNAKIHIADAEAVVEDLWANVCVLQDVDLLACKHMTVLMTTRDNLEMTSANEAATTKGLVP